MKTMQAREAKASFSLLIEAASRGEPTTITKHGRPTAVVISMADAERLFGDQKSFGRHLLAFPGGIEFERDPSPPREVDL